MKHYVVYSYNVQRYSGEVERKDFRNTALLYICIVPCILYCEQRKSEESHLLVYWIREPSCVVITNRAKLAILVLGLLCRRKNREQGYILLQFMGTLRAL